MTGDEAAAVIAALEARVGDLESSLASLTRALTVAGRVAGVDLFGEGYEQASRPALRLVK